MSYVLSSLPAASICMSCIAMGLTFVGMQGRLGFEFGFLMGSSVRLRVDWMELVICCFSIDLGFIKYCFV